MVILSHLKFRNKTLNSNNKKNHTALDTRQQQANNKNQVKNTSDLTVPSNREKRDKSPDTRQPNKTLNTLNVNKAEDTRQRNKSPQRVNDVVAEKGHLNKRKQSDDKRKLTRQDDVTSKDSKNRYVRLPFFSFFDGDSKLGCLAIMSFY